jgi:adenylate cyclase
VPHPNGGEAMDGSVRANVFSFLAGLGADPADGADARLQKTLLVISALMMSTLAIVWGSIYLFFGETIAASIPLGYTALSYASILYFAKTRQYNFFRFTQLLFPLVLPFGLMIALGGFINSSAVILWSITSPMGALWFAGRRQAIGWFIAYLALIVIGAALEPYLRQTNSLAPEIITVFFIMNIGCTSIVAFVLLQYFLIENHKTMQLLRLERERSESLLLNILPKDIADVLKVKSRTIAHQFDEASILFADVADFTPMSADLTPVELVELLTEVFEYFDKLVEKYDLEKIKTIGDCYMVAAGVPRPRHDHAQALIRMALEAREFTNRNRFRDRRLIFRIGVHSGPLVAGVIGRKKFAYDLWGDSVNTASRMESHGVCGQVQITRDTWRRIKDEFICEPAGRIDVKGKGEMEVWHVLACR